MVGRILNVEHNNFALTYTRCPTCNQGESGTHGGSQKRKSIYLAVDATRIPGGSVNRFHNSSSSTHVSMIRFP